MFLNGITATELRDAVRRLNSNKVTVSVEGEDMSKLESAFHWQIVATRTKQPEQEYRFHPTRKWRFDFAWPELMLAVEIEGHGGAKSRHTTFTGYTKDCEKYNEAVILGWRVLRFTGPMVKSGEALSTTERALDGLKSKAV